MIVVCACGDARCTQAAAENPGRYTDISVTHSMQPAARVSQRSGLFRRGDLVEVDPTEKIFQDLVDPRTRDCITDRFG